MKTLLDVKTRLLKNKAMREAYLALEDEFFVAHAHSGTCQSCAPHNPSLRPNKINQATGED